MNVMVTKLYPVIIHKKYRTFHVGVSFSVQVNQEVEFAPNSNARKHYYVTDTLNSPLNVYSTLATWPDLIKINSYALSLAILLRGYMITVWRHLNIT